MSVNDNVRGAIHMPLSGDDHASAHAVARRLLDREANGGAETDALCDSLQRATGRLFDDLSAAVGADGLDALLTRAIARTQGEHPAVTSMHADGAGLPLDIGAAIEAYGADAARAGLEAVIAALVDTLAALIGADMTRNLLHDDVA